MKKALFALSILFLSVALTGCTEMEEKLEIAELEDTTIDKALICDYIGVSEEKLDKIIDDLNIEVKVADSVLPSYFIKEYQNTHSDWNLVKDQSYSENGISGRLLAWQHLLEGHAIAVISGDLVKTKTGHDVVVITSHANILMYEKYINEFNLDIEV